MLGGPTSTAPPMGCYRTTDSSGADIAGVDVPHQISQDLATKMYSTMTALQIVDTVFYEAQRQVSTRSPAGIPVVSAKLHMLQSGLANAGEIFILHDQRRRGSHSCGFCSSLEPGRHCKQLTCLCKCLHCEDSDFVKINMVAFNWRCTACCQ